MQYTYAAYSMHNFVDVIKNEPYFTMFIFYSNFRIPPLFWGCRNSQKNGFLSNFVLLRFCFLILSLRVDFKKSYIVIHIKNAFELYIYNIYFLPYGKVWRRRQDYGVGADSTIFALCK